MKHYIRLMRPHHYIKNFLVALPVFFAGQIFEADYLWAAICGILSFCFLSSFIYIVNDICDIEHDRLHEKKKHRPLASGAVSLRNAAVLAALTLTICFCFHLLTGTALPGLYLLLYLAVNLGYSLGLKKVPIVDIAILAAGFLIRMMYGSAITSIPASEWLYLMVLSVAFYLGLGKRRNEWVKSSDGATRFVLTRYTYNFLDKSMYMCMTLSLCFYALWAMDAARGPGLIWTVPIVILIFMKYNLHAEGESFGDPVDVLLSDRVLIGLVAFYTLFIGAVLYIG